MHTTLFSIGYRATAENLQWFLTEDWKHVVVDPFRAGIRLSDGCITVRRAVEDGDMKLFILPDNTIRFDGKTVALQDYMTIPEDFRNVLETAFPQIIVRDEILRIDATFAPEVEVDAATFEPEEPTADLIPVDTSTGEPRTDARTLHTKLGNKRKFADWFPQRVEECDLVNNEDFGVNHKFVKNPQGGRPVIDYWLKLDAAKEMAMLERNEAGKSIRRYLIDVEKKWRAQQTAPTAQRLTMSELCQAYLQQEEQLKLAITTTDTVTVEKDREIAKLASKVETPTRGITIKQFAKDTASVLGYTSSTIYQYLTDTGVLVKEANGSWGDVYVPSGEWDRSGYFQIGKPYYDRPTGNADETDPSIPEVVRVNTRITKLTRDTADTSGTVTRQGGYSWLLNKMLKDPRTTLSRMCADTGGANGKYSKLYGCRLLRSMSHERIMDSKADPSIIHFYKGKQRDLTVWSVGRHIGDGQVMCEEGFTLESALEVLCSNTPDTAPKALGKAQ